MNDKSNKNLEELFGQFYNEGQARQAVEDVHDAEQILNEYAMPEPDGELLANIKADIAGVLLQRKKTVALRRIVYRVAVTAAVIILAAIGLELFERNNMDSEKLATTSVIPRTLWKSGDIFTDDTDLAILAAEIDQIEDEIIALELSENGSDGYQDLADLEMKLIEINSDFWKG